MGFKFWWQTFMKQLHKLIGEKWKWKFQSCSTLCNSMDYTVHGILQARILDWVAMPFSRDLPNPGIEPSSPELQEDSLSSKLPR